MRTPSTPLSGPMTGGLPRAASATAAPGQSLSLFTTALSAADDLLFGEQDAAADTAPGSAVSGLPDAIESTALAADPATASDPGAGMQALDIAMQVPNALDPGLLLAQSGLAGTPSRPEVQDTAATSRLPGTGSTSTVRVAAMQSTIDAGQRNPGPPAAGVAAPVDDPLRPEAARSSQPDRVTKPVDLPALVDAGPTADPAKARTVGAAEPPIRVPSQAGGPMPAAPVRPEANESAPLRMRLSPEDGGTPGVLADQAVLPHPRSAVAAEAVPQARAAERVAALQPAPGGIEPTKELALVPAALEFAGLQRLDRQKPASASGAAAPADAGGAAFAAPLPVMSAGASAATELAGIHHAPAEHLVNQVSWWLSQNVQGADFQIDMPGGTPVSVSVQIRGNEAQVAFQSDQPEIRQVLAQALPQLKDAFGHEGLLLAGASVGGNADGRGADRSGARQPSPPQGPAVRGTGLREPGAAIAAVRAVSVGASGRSLDLYV